MDVAIRQLTDSDLEAVVALSLDAWAPVFDSFEDVMGSRVFGLLYPDWQVAQARAVSDVCRADGVEVWVADAGGRPVGFVAVRSTQEGASAIGEIDMIAVDPKYQRAGIGRRLLDRALAEMSARGLPLSVIATGGDPGHAPARALYEAHGFTALPLVMYYRAL